MDDQRTFAALKCLIDERRLTLGVNLTGANTPGTPGYRGYENLLAMWGTIALVVLVFIGYGWLIGLVSVPVGIAVFLFAGRVVQKRAGSRTKQWALSSASRFLAMWNTGVISVRDAQSGCTAIAARGDDLGQFTRATVDEILGTDGDPVAERLGAALDRL